MLQLLLTFGIISMFAFNDQTKLWAAKNPSVLLLCMVATFVLMICMACCTSVRRQAPMNFIFLFLFTLAEGVMLGFVSARQNGEAVSRYMIYLQKTILT